MHEHLETFKLINMNGRVYDPVLGRFLSPDNYVQDAGSTQAYNRYTYCLNNPLVYTDPSGWKWLVQETWEWNEQALATFNSAISSFLSHFSIFNGGSGGNSGSFGVAGSAGANSFGKGRSTDTGDEKLTLGQAIKKYLSEKCPNGGYWSEDRNFEFKSQQEGFLAGYLYNFEHNSWGYTKGTSAYASVQRFKTIIAEENFTKNMAADVSGKLYSSNNYGPDFKGYFHGVACFETSLFSSINEQGVTIPEIGIFLYKGGFSDLDIKRHEYGHILQYILWGPEKYYDIIAPISLYSAKQTNYLHRYTWTEWSANRLAYFYFNEPIDWDYTRENAKYPISVQGYSPLNWPFKDYHNIIFFYSLDYFKHK